MKSGEITHTGIVKKLSERKVVVGIINESACAGCHAKGACTAADMQDKEVEIYSFNQQYQIGQHVTIVGKTTQGFKALFLAYLLPFLLVLAVLIVSTILNIPEGKAGLSALGILIPYYVTLYLLRNTIKKSFEFEIKPLD